METRRIGLIGSAVSDHPQFGGICTELAGEGYELGVSSFRADAVTSPLIGTLVQSGMKTLTLAPETGSERLRGRIHKNLTDAEILQAAGRASEGGIENLKLYFLIGLPFKDQDDGPEIVTLVKEIRDAFLGKHDRKGKITVSIHPFVPKAWTPFQWCRMVHAQQSAALLDAIATALQPIRGVRVTPKSPKRAVLQGIFSVGDRRIGEAIRLKVTAGLHWRSVWKQLHIDPAWYVYRDKGYEEILPWEVLDVGVDKKYLWQEYQNAQAEGCRDRYITS